MSHYSLTEHAIFHVKYIQSEMKKIETHIEIKAPAEKVWDILTDFEGHSRWNPFIKSIEGKKRAGEQLKVLLHPPGGFAMTLRPKVLVFNDKKEFRWKGRLFIPGLFDGEHYFILIRKNDTTTRFVHGEKFSGILVGVFGGVLEKTLKGFEMMNDALKTECEKSSRPG